MKVNGKHPILGSRRAQTLWPIDLKFDAGDYVGGMTPHAKNCENRPDRAAPAWGWNITFKCFFLFLYFLVTSCQALENIFLGVSPPFLCQTTWFGEDWFPSGVSQLQRQNFSTLKKHQFLDPFLDLENFRPKRFIMGRFISKLPLIVTAAPWKLQSE